MQINFNFIYIMFNKIKVGGFTVRWYDALYTALSFARTKKRGGEYCRPQDCAGRRLRPERTKRIHTPSTNSSLTPQKTSRHSTFLFVRAKMNGIPTDNISLAMPILA